MMCMGCQRVRIEAEYSDTHTGGVVVDNTDTEILRGVQKFLDGAKKITIEVLR